MDKSVLLFSIFLTISSLTCYSCKDKFLNIYIKKISEIKCNQIINEYFKSQIQINPNYSFDELILLFENAKHSSLEEFAKSKGRSADIYRKLYYKFYIQNKLKQNKMN